MAALEPQYMTILKKALAERFVPSLPPLLDTTKPAAEQQAKQLSRAFSAFVLHKLLDITPQAAAAEFDALFGGVGKPEVWAYGSHYLSGFLNDKPLAQLRTDLAQLGLTRDEALAETEDHIAYLCEVMRYLIAGDDAGQCHLANQRKFFGL